MSKGKSLLHWIDQRFPLSSSLKAHATEYYAPKNFNFWYFFGSLAMLVLVMQLLTGIFLTMNYKPDASLLPGTDISVAFASVEYLMRDVSGGWIIRYMHSTGASLFFVVVYLHMFRGLIYGSYQQPRQLVWIFGMLIFLFSMAEAFLGYLLPWGQMSFWGAQVIVNLFSAIPIIGPDLALFIRGDYVVSDVTLNRFFALHVIAVPLVLLGLVVAHLIALHEVGSNNPDGIEIKHTTDPVTHIPLDGIAFHPYYTVKDVLGVAVFLVVFATIMFFLPEMGGYFLEANNFLPANPLQTPTHIAPVWYFTPFYAILRAVPSFAGTQVWGVLAMGAAVGIIAFLPWLDKALVKSVRYRGKKYKFMLTLFVIAFIGLGILGALPPTEVRTLLAQLFSVIYFTFFIAMPIYTKNDVGAVPVPSRVTVSTARRKLNFMVMVGLLLIVSVLFVVYI